MSMKRSRMALLLLIGLLGMPSFGQCDSELIDNIEVLMISGMEMRPNEKDGLYYADITVGIRNKNEQTLKLEKSVFDFSLGRTNVAAQRVYIGRDLAYQQQDIVLEPNVITPVTFHLKTTTAQHTDLETGIQIVNFLGQPSAERHIYIEGRFNFGIKMERGWSIGEAVRVEWTLCPQIKPQLPLRECLVEEVAPTLEIGETVEMGCNNFVRAGRDIVVPRLDTYLVDMGKPTGTFALEYQTYTEPDRIVIEYEGKTLLDTGCIGDSGRQAVTYSGKENTIKVSLYSRCDFVGPMVTDWDFSISCPQ